ncbi:uracil phosphoribosyltransferase [Stetteria hydrogenophila]
MRVRVLSEELPAAGMILARLRSSSTGLAGFRSGLRLAGVALALSVSRELEWRRVRVKTPHGTAEGLEPEAQPLLVALLGAGAFMAEGFLSVYEDAPLSFAHVKRDGGVEASYEGLPPRIRGPAVILDPTVATGRAVDAVASELKARGAARVLVASVVASRDAVLYLAERHPDLVLHTIAVDPRLDSRGHIIPGLGDADQRALGAGGG